MATKIRPSKDAQHRWIERIFSAKAARSGGIVYRAVDQVNRWGSFKELKDAAKSRKFHLLRVGDLYLIICHSPASVKIIC